jgi:hypothetical protein
MAHITPNMASGGRDTSRLERKRNRQLKNLKCTEENQMMPPQPASEAQMMLPANMMQQLQEAQMTKSQMNQVPAMATSTEAKPPGAQGQQMPSKVQREMQQMVANQCQQSQALWQGQGFEQHDNLAQFKRNPQRSSRMQGDVPAETEHEQMQQLIHIMGKDYSLPPPLAAGLQQACQTPLAAGLQPACQAPMAGVQQLGQQSLAGGGRKGLELPLPAGLLPKREPPQAACLPPCNLPQNLLQMHQQLLQQQSQQWMNQQWTQQMQVYEPASQPMKQQANGDKVVSVAGRPPGTQPASSTCGTLDQIPYYMVPLTEAEDDETVAMAMMRGSHLGPTPVGWPEASHEQAQLPSSQYVDSELDSQPLSCGSLGPLQGSLETSSTQQQHHHQGKTLADMIGLQSMPPGDIEHGRRDGEPFANGVLDAKSTIGADEDTMKGQLQALELEDPATVLIARRISRLGFASAEVLEAHFASYGPVRGVHVSHSRAKSLRPRGGRRRGDEVYWRLRAAGLGFIVMYSAEDANKILRDGPEHNVRGTTVMIQPFKHRPVSNLSKAEEEEEEVKIEEIPRVPLCGARERWHSPDSDGAPDSPYEQYLQWAPPNRCQ